MDGLGNQYIADDGNYLLRVVYQSGSALSAALVAANPTRTFTPTAGYMYGVGSGASTTSLTTGGYCNGSSGAKALDTSGDGCPAEYFTFHPFAVGVDSTGNIFFSSNAYPTASSSVIHVFYVGGAAAASLITAYNPTVTAPQVGYVYALSASASVAAADFATVADIAIDSNENVYVSDNGTQVAVTGTGLLATTTGAQIKKFVSSPKAGWATYINSTGNTVGALDGDGGPVSAASVSTTVSGLLFDANNNLYIEDSGNGGRVRVVYNTAGSQTLPLYTVSGSTASAIVTTPVAGDIYTAVGASATSQRNNGSKATALGGLAFGAFGLDQGNNLVIDIDAELWRINPITDIAEEIGGPGGDNPTGTDAATPAAGAYCSGGTSGPKMINAYGDGCPASMVYNQHPAGSKIGVDPSNNYYMMDSRAASGLPTVVQEYSYPNQFGTVAVGQNATLELAFGATVNRNTYTPTLSLVGTGASTTEFTDSGANDLCLAVGGAVYQTCFYNVTFTPSVAGARWGPSS